jgi:hypothetical protein
MGDGFFCLLAGVVGCFEVLVFLLVFLLLWPFLAFLSVYWRCPCAGRHSLFFAVAKKSKQKKAGSHR